VSQKFTSFIAKLNQNDLIAIAALIAEGKVRPIIDRCYSLSEVPDALRYLEERHARGKVIIKLDQESTLASPATRV
jgi:NADPH:quinone reductase-like Zn-dependent oxidoreductase